MAKLKSSKKPQPRASSELLAGLELQRQNRLEEAETLFHFVLKDDATNWRALHQLGAIHLTRGHYVEALQYLGAAMKVNAGSAEVTSNYGVVLRKLQRDDEAIEYFNRALMLRPGYVPAILTRGTSFHYLGRREEALASFDRVIEIDPNHAKAHYNRANVLHELKRFDEAIKSFVQASTLAPEDPDIQWNEGLSRLLTGDYREGWEKYEWRWKRGNLPPRNFKHHFGLANTLSREK
jgi:tetratricopeptide (TPR) repeat protein